MSGQAGRYQRSAAGMVGAMVVSVALIAAVVVFRDVNRNEPADPVRAIQYQEVGAVAQEAVGFDLLVPAQLPEGWIATSADFAPEPPRWHLGMLTGEEKYVGVEQARAGASGMVQEFVDAQADKGKLVEAAGTTWQTWTDAGGDAALVRTQAGVTTLVVGTVQQDVLVDFVNASARPAR